MSSARFIRIPSTSLVFALALGLSSAAQAMAPMATRYGELPLGFEANRGQSDERVKFLARGAGYGLFITQTEAVLRLGSGDASQVVRIQAVGGDRAAVLEGLEPLSHGTSYFAGSDPAQWQRDITSYARVKRARVYPGIDLIYYGNQRRLEYDFIVSPGADPRRIALAFDGVEGMSLDPHGNLVLKTGAGELVQHRPAIYQEVDGARQAIGGRYVLRARGRVGFEVDKYDRKRPLVIDPVLVYSTFLGGAGNDLIRGIAVDANGSAYVTGSTTSAGFPGTSGSTIGNAPMGSTDAFVAKLTPSGNALVYAAYVGGSGGETAYAIAVDTAGNAYVTGETDSNANQPGAIAFPTVAALQGLYKGGGDAFVTKINAAGNGLIYSTYLGGGGNERGYGIAVDASGNAYITGHTSSDNTSSGPTGGFPVLSPLQGNNAGVGNFDAFVTKLSPTGGMIYSTYLGGLSSEFSIEGGGIAVDSLGNAYVAGSTASTNFPGASASTIQPAHGGGATDGFVAKLNPAGSALVYSTYLGGSTYDSVYGIAVDASGNAYVAGFTDSTNFPLASPMQPTKGGAGNDAFVAKINAAGSALVYSTYLGGSGGDMAYDIAVDAAGNAHVSGWTDSADFPLAYPYQATPGGSGDAFVVKLNAAGSGLIFGTYLGGSVGVEHAYGIALDSGGNVYVGGLTASTNFPTLNAIQGTKGAALDAFVTRIRLSTPRALTDLNGGGRSDLLYRNGSTGQVYRMLMNGLAITNGAMAYVEPTLQWKIVGDADFTGDGVGDVLWRNVSTGDVYVMPSQPSGFFGNGAVVAHEPNAAWKIVHTPDLDGDGKADILWWNSTTGQVYAMLMNGLSVGAQGFVYTEPDTFWRIVATGDFAGSGKSNQLLWRHALSGQLYLIPVSLRG